MDTGCPLFKQATTNTAKVQYHFVIIGSGWRAQYYVRIANALPEVFELCAMYCRTEEKAAQIAAEYNIHTTTSMEECLSLQPDFVVVAVTKTAIADVSMEWLRRGFTVLCETPVAVDLETLKRICRYTGTAFPSNSKQNNLPDISGQGSMSNSCPQAVSPSSGEPKLVVAEQYQFYPEYIALQRLLEKGLIGAPNFLTLSAAHDYHAASLMRAFLGVSADTDFTVTAKTFSFPTVETLTRYEHHTDGRIADKKRTLAVFTFADGKTAFYDFDSEQYRSPIRGNWIKIQGCRGEIMNQHVNYLDRHNQPISSDLVIESRQLETESTNPNFHTVREITRITFEGEPLYTPEFGLCGLPQDETAIAHLMKQTAEYARGNAGSPYTLREAIQDAYMGILLRQADKIGVTVES
ncbi:MAG: Gfo/Idh/MocA family oxidoreductase [Lachnospiraceae bacterium]|nr:Gfo/Idh/MocA family oxidoreductase [Lachnospiraceae bacterium]